MIEIMEFIIDAACNGDVKSQVIDAKRAADLAFIVNEIENKMGKLLGPLV